MNRWQILGLLIIFWLPVAYFLGLPLWNLYMRTLNRWEDRISARLDAARAKARGERVPDEIDKDSSEQRAWRREMRSLWIIAKLKGL